MRVTGVVRRVEEGDAWVEVAVGGGCGRCNEPGGCGGVNVARPLALQSTNVRVANRIQARPGDTVAVVVDDGVPLRAALLAYGWPVLGIIGGAAAGTLAASPGQGDLLASLGALAGGLVAYLAGRARSRRQDAPQLRLERPDLTVSGGCPR